MFNYVIRFTNIDYLEGEGVRLQDNYKLITAALSTLAQPSPYHQGSGRTPQLLLSLPIFFQQRLKIPAGRYASTRVGRISK